MCNSCEGTSHSNAFRVLASHMNEWRGQRSKDRKRGSLSLSHSLSAAKQECGPSVAQSSHGWRGAKKFENLEILVWNLPLLKWWQLMDNRVVTAGGGGVRELNGKRKNITNIIYLKNNKIKKLKNKMMTTHTIFLKNKILHRSNIIHLLTKFGSALPMCNSVPYSQLKNRTQVMYHTQCFPGASIWTFH